jgi:cob(I)alamin adenosyltransferase
VDGSQVQRLKIYTKTGDAGQTGLIGGLRVSKTDVRICAIGEVDELNASIGWIRVQLAFSDLSDVMNQVQGWLFEIGAELASPGEERFATLNETAVHALEGSIDRMVAGLPELKNFILPGGTELAARLHIARSVCRRAERTVLVLHNESPVRKVVRVFLNRLADWLFVAARTANSLENVKDVCWKRE